MPPPPSSHVRPHSLPQNRKVVPPAAIISRANGPLKNHNNAPTLTITPESFLSKDSDMIACEVECRRDGIDGVFVVLDIPGLDALRDPLTPPINEPRA